MTTENENDNGPRQSNPDLSVDTWMVSLGAIGLSSAEVLLGSRASLALGR
jgi:hypothetical protein